MVRDLDEYVGECLEAGAPPGSLERGGWITFTSLSTGGVELLRDAKAIFFNCFALQNFENDKYIRSFYERFGEKRPVW